jgi:hypothetical protein
MARAATERLKVNPPVGSEASTARMASARRNVADRFVLSADSSTPRKARPSSGRLLMFWDWDLCQPSRPWPSARMAKLLIVDGQHRASAAKLRGDIPHLPCVITSYASAGDEAAAFVALNQMRRPLNALDLFKAAVAAQDDEALLILKAITDAGLKIAKHSNYTRWKVGDIANIGGIQRGRSIFPSRVRSRRGSARPQGRPPKPQDRQVRHQGAAPRVAALHAHA